MVSIRRTLPLLTLVGDLKTHFHSHAGCFSSKVGEKVLLLRIIWLIQIGNWYYGVRNVWVSFLAVSLASIATPHGESWLPLTLDFIIMLFSRYLWTHSFPTHPRPRWLSSFCLKNLLVPPYLDPYLLSQMNICFGLFSTAPHLLLKELKIKIFFIVAENTRFILLTIFNWTVQ